MTDIRAFRHGDRVRWAADEGDPPDMVAMRGTVQAPTADQVAYVATWSPTARAAIRNHVVVEWDSDEPGDGAWHHPDDLHLAEES